MTVIGRRRRANAETLAQPELSPAVLGNMDRRAAEASATRLAELERIHEDAMARHSQLASDYAALIDALHARSPQEWHVGEPATAGLAYLRHLEDEADRCGIDRRPPWCRDVRPRDERMFRSLAEERGAEEQFGLPVPVRTAPEAAEDTKDSGPAPDEIPGSGPAGPDTNPVPEAARPPAGEEAGPAAEQASPEASGTVSEDGEPVQDEPAEPDCGAEA